MDSLEFSSVSHYRRFYVKDISNPWRGARKYPSTLIAAPLTGLIVQPIVGYLSDNTWHPKFGRRRPYFLIGAILSSIALFIVPHSPTLWIAAGLLWVLDASINISMEPSEL